MIQINLLPDIKKELLKAQRLRNLTISICIFATIAAGVVLVILGGTLGGQAIQKNLLTNNIRNNFSEILDKKENNNLDNYLTVQNQLSNLDTIREAQSVYSRLFLFLSQINPAPPNNVELSSLQIGDTRLGMSSPNSMTISGTTTSFAALDNFRNALTIARISYAESPDSDVQRENLFTAVSVTDASLSQDHRDGVSVVNFIIVTEFNPMAFSNRVDTESITIEIAGHVSNNDTPIFREER